MTDLRKAYPYRWTRKPTYEELDQIFDRCRELHQRAEKKLCVLEKLVEDWLPQIGMTVTFREMFYEVLGKPNPGWLGERQLTNTELKWIAEAVTVREGTITMTQWIIDDNEWKTFLELREKLFKAIKECLDIDGHGKSYEGGFDIEYSLPNYFEEGERKATWRIHLACYLIGPTRGTDWYGETFSDALFKAEQDINGWLKDHEEWLERIKNDPNWVI